MNAPASMMVGTIAALIVVSLLVWQRTRQRDVAAPPSPVARGVLLLLALAGIGVVLGFARPGHQSLLMVVVMLLVMPTVALLGVDVGRLVQARRG